MMAFKNEFENEEDEYPGVGDKFGFIRKILVVLCSHSEQLTHATTITLVWDGA
jgi:hypothetical protein